jgi:cellulose biosynthesis protein BcsQ
MKKTIVIAVQNNKGGVGKTTCVLNLSHALSNSGIQVLAIDLDSQANLTKLMMPDLRQDAETMYEYLQGDILNIKKIIFETPYKGAHLIPNILETSSLEPKMYQDLPRNYYFVNKLIHQDLKSAGNPYNIIILDTPPNLGFWTISALYAADFVIVPVEISSQMAHEGLKNSLVLIEAIRKEVNPNLRFLRLLINKLDRRTQISRISISELKKMFDKTEVFETTIPTNTAIQQAEMDRKSIIRFNPSVRGSVAYRNLADELLGIIKSTTPA